MTAKEPQKCKSVPICDLCMDETCRCKTCKSGDGAVAEAWAIKGPDGKIGRGTIRVFKADAIESTIPAFVNDDDGVFRWMEMEKEGYRCVREQAKAEERVKFIKIAEFVANRIPDFNRMDYMMLLRKAIYEATNPAPTDTGNGEI